MKIFVGLLASVAFFSTAAEANFKTILLEPDSEISLPLTCKGADSKIQLKDGQVGVIGSLGKAYSLNLDEQLEKLPIMVGSSGDSGECVLAVKYAENDVNESYSLFVFDSVNGKYKSSAVPIVTNPEFSAGKVLSNYRDGAVTHNDTLCFSSTNKDYYVCEKREQFTEGLERIQKCNESKCLDTAIVKENTSSPIGAVVVSPKVYLSDRNEDSTFSQRKAYLVVGDKVVLTDFFSGDEGMYYKVVYEGKSKTVGWLSSESVRVNE